MLYRILVVQLPNNKFSVDRIAYTKMKDRFTVMYHVNQHLGPPFNTLMEAANHANEILDLLVKIERNDAMVESAANHEDANELKILRERGTAYREYLNQLTRTA